MAHDILTLQLNSGIHIKNAALRAIIRRVQKQCEESTISFMSSINYSDFSFMAFKDICSFFANAFDNAIRACKQAAVKDAYITVEITVINEIIHVKIANTNTLVVAKSRLGFISTKSKNYRMSIGTKNMQRSLERYNGMMDISLNNDHFEVSAIIPIPLPESAG